MQKPSNLVITLSIISVCVVISIIITLIVLIALNDEPKLETTDTTTATDIPTRPPITGTKTTKLTTTTSIPARPTPSTTTGP